MVHEVARETVTRLPTEGVAVTDVTVRRAALLRRVSWGAIIAGAAVAITIQLIFSTLGSAVGLAAIDPTSSGWNMALGAGIWWLVTGLMSLFIGGAVAGRLAGFPQRAEAALHGVLVWSLTAIIGVMFLSTSAATFLGGALGPVARSYSYYNTSSSRAPGVRSGLSVVGNEAMNQLNRLNQPTPKSPATNPADMPPAHPSNDLNAATTPPTETGVPPTNRPEAYSEPGAGAQTMSEQEKKDAAKTLAGAAMWSFFALLLGSGAGCIGGQVGRPPIGVSLE